MTDALARMGDMVGLREPFKRIGRLEIHPVTRRAGRRLGRPRDIARVLVLQCGNVEIVLEEALLQFRDVPLAELLRGLAAPDAFGGGGSADLTERREGGHHANGAERHVRRALAAPGEEEVVERRRVEDAVWNRVYGQRRMMLPVAVGLHRLHAARVVGIHRPATVGNAVGEHPRRLLVVAGHHVVAAKPQRLAPPVDERNRQQLLVCQ